MRESSRHILPAALLCSVVLHLLAYGSLVTCLNFPARNPRMGEGEGRAVLIEVGLHSPRPPVSVARDQGEPERKTFPVPAAQSGSALLPPPSVSRPEKPAPAAVAAPAGRSGRSEVTTGPAAEEYLRRVRRRIEAATYYPRRARRGRLEGTVRVGFLIDSAGGLREARLLAPSSHQLFNRAALEILDRAAPFPEPAAGITGNLISVSISFESTY